MKPALLLAALASAMAQTPTGRWDGTVTIGGMRVPFTLELKAEATAVSGTFVNGDDRTASSGGSFTGDVLRLVFDQTETKFEAKLDHGTLTGTSGGHAIEASAYCTCSYEGEAGPDISGTWGAEGHAGFAISRNGEETIAILGRTGDVSNSHRGRFDGLQFTLNRFDGKSASAIEIVPRKDGALDVALLVPGKPAKKFRAERRGTPAQ